MRSKLFKAPSVFGIFLGLLFFSAALTPSLLPRLPDFQGVLCGFAFAVGYAVAQFIQFVWWLLELDPLANRIKRSLLWITGAVSVVTVLVTLARTTTWQNSIRERMEMPPVEVWNSLLIVGIAVGTALVLIMLTRIVVWFGRRVVALLARVLPYRIAAALGTVLAAFLVFSIVNDFVLQKATRGLDVVFANIDRVTHEGTARPEDAFSSGGPRSTIAWDDIGTNGKDFLSRGPHQADIAEFWGRDAMQPVRVYAGYGTGDNFEDRAEAAVADLIALGGFERSVLVVATPTGTGWLDPAAVEPLPYIHKGDIAIVSLQYAYVPSWMSLLIEPDRSRLAAQELFDAVYGHWTTLPKESRPELFLFGLSLGALGSETSIDLIKIFDDPISGALWAGPPFASTRWAEAVAHRNAGSPMRLPEFRDGAMLRFMNQETIATPGGATWGSMRFMYMQYASDPMVFFSPSLLLRRPDWLKEDRGPDLSEYFDWYPLVTFLQVGFDVPMATSTPSGFGHTYDARDYIRAWIEVLNPQDWGPDRTQQLLQRFEGFTASPI
jgi:uncharacterized membrane protein